MMRLVGVVAIAMLVPLPAMAVGSFGARVGVGVGFPNDDAGGDDVTVTNFAVGAGWRLSLPLLTLEVNALFHRSSFEVGSAEGSIDTLALPVLARIGMPLIPLLSIGAGLEARFPIATDPEETKDHLASPIIYLPLLIGAGFDLGGFGIGVDARYHVQLTQAAEEGTDDDRIHELMLFGGAWF